MEGVHPEIDRATGSVCDQSNEEFCLPSVRGKPIGAERMCAVLCGDVLAECRSDHCLYVMTFAGPSLVQMTMERYGHLFPTPDYQAAMALVEQRVFG